jgi:Carboxypeptidase regulatory-like domain
MGCIALLVAIPGAAAASSTGSISGIVTSACACEDFSPLKGIEVTVYEGGGKERPPVAFVTTGVNGEYTVEGLQEGEYKVEFYPGFEGNQNFIPQFYKNEPSFEAAESVKVVKEATTKDIDAEMEPGGQIEGTVTDVLTHKALANTLVVALGPAEVVEGVTFTEANGRYVINALKAGSYKVGFADSGYVIQYYNDQSSFALANSLLIGQGTMLTGIDAALVSKAPLNTVAPVVSGTPAVGQTLSCSNGSWTGIPAPTFTRTWLRDGVAITGATASAYVVQPADQGNGLTCKVTAKNASGSLAVLSNTLIVPVPSPPPPVPVLTLSSSKITVSGDSARVPIACASATCAGTIELTERVVVRHRHGRRTTSKKQTVVLGRVTYALAAGHGATITVHLTSAGRSALAAAGHHRLSAKLSASVVGGATVIGSVVLSEATPKHKHGRR